MAAKKKTEGPKHGASESAAMASGENGAPAVLEEGQQPPPRSPNKRQQTDLPGVEGAGVGEAVIPEIEDLAIEYVKHRDARLVSGRNEKFAKDLLIAGMKKHELVHYEFDDKVVELKPKDATDNVAVKAKKDGKDYVLEPTDDENEED